MKFVASVSLDESARGMHWSLTCIWGSLFTGCEYTPSHFGNFHISYTKLQILAGPMCSTRWVPVDVRSVIQCHGRRNLPPHKQTLHQLILLPLAHQHLECSTPSLEILIAQQLCCQKNVSAFICSVLSLTLCSSVKHTTLLKPCPLEQ